MELSAPPHCPTCVCGQVAHDHDDDGSDRIVRIELFDDDGVLLGVHRRGVD